ncbi:NTP transferase domain-containing protein [Pseudoalteromonas elyakovii]|uniref:NTP transferase domain-containing protein n=1 Tax=Pseudoalteromonas shioyasakiensis TaxID=1190813 RepID=A0ABT6U082_9GAMM|nr:MULTISPECIES: NTP transferase domain-containing protein [Pseudoalteromonas]MDC3188717.1 NTP transferase domain-containing protein [Pseudoalteromonas elyakovii]MDI4669572.1 NTP transferase domain-containing protein [Pseudoalteromonas shioyasakiensis]MDI4674391.1 NTP transferase domain-containing protein [Pseudoalteromonas shioyasakiensis]MDI4686476.1 NTP transferase domain-containing protein [Pseudoalteromonas shioyasakiensis]MDI4704766.1 NTP transferase domain-containing protein [Pseudoalte
MAKVIAFIQARMGSSRLPNKVLKNINGRPVIVQVVERLKKAACIDDTVLLTSTNQENDELCLVAKEHGIKYFRGPEENVLQRFQLATELYPCEFVIRITGDTPFVDADICERLCTKVIDENAQYGFLSEMFAEGVDCEVVETKALKGLVLEALRPSELEHVTLHLYENKEQQYRVIELNNDTDDSHYRFTLDTPEDWQVINAIADANDDTLNVTYQQIKAFLDSHPEVKAINAQIVRNEGLLISLKNEQQDRE